jgi:hypothetical protein
LESERANDLLLRHAKAKQQHAGPAADISVLPSPGTGRQDITTHSVRWGPTPPPHDDDEDVPPRLARDLDRGAVTRSRSP